MVLSGLHNNFAAANRLMFSSFSTLLLFRLAVHNMHYVSNVLGIRDPIHKQKIALKAMDVVLFGPPRGKKSQDKTLNSRLISTTKFHPQKLEPVGKTIF